MPLPYENTTSGKNALSEIQKVLSAFGCNKFGSMVDNDKREVIVQFEYRGRRVSVTASAAGYAAAYLRAHPYSKYSSKTEIEHERKANAIAEVAVYSILRDWVKGQVTAIETGILSFEGAFLGQILLPNGKTILEHATDLKMLPAP